MKRNVVQGLLYLKYIALGHVFNPLWRERKRRRIRRETLNLERKLYYLSRYIPFIQGLTPGGEELRQSPEPEHIFSIWFQGEDEAPKIVKACWESARRKSEMPLKVLDDKTLFDWIELPDYIMEKWRKGLIRPAHFADICRVELLYRHGGVWMDATDFLVSDLPDWMKREDFFIYLAGHDIGGWYSFVQNCFFRAKKGNALLKMWRDTIFEYWRLEDKPADYFFHQILFRLVVENNEYAKSMFEAMPHIDQDPTHTIWYLYKDRPFEAERYAELVKGACFQKTAYRDKNATNPIPGSYADYIVNNKV